MQNARIPDAYAEFEDVGATAFNFTGQLMAPSWGPGPTTIGSPMGAPPATHIAGMEPVTDTGANSYASEVMGRGAGSHPVLWSVILFMAGIVLLGFVSHIETKRRG